MPGLRMYDTAPLSGSSYRSKSLDVSGVAAHRSKAANQAKRVPEARAALTAHTGFDVIMAFFIAFIVYHIAAAGLGPERHWLPSGVKSARIAAMQNTTVKRNVIAVVDRDSSDPATKTP